MQRRVDGEVLAVAAADVEPDGAGPLALQEAGDERPGGVAGGRKVWCDLVVDGVHVCGFVCFCVLG